MTGEAAGTQALRNALSRLTRAAVDLAGAAGAAAAAVLLVLAWLVVAMTTGFGARWLAALYAVTAAVTFVMVFVIQHATGRDLRAVLLKLDELVDATDGARDDVINAERRPLHVQERLERRGPGNTSGQDDGRARRLVEPGGDLPVVDDFDELVELVRRRPGLYLRYSKGPETDLAEGPSRDYEASVGLPGLSVTTIDPEPWWTRSAADWVARRLCKYAELGEEQDRFAWLMAGHQTGLGPDHEPVVVDAEPVVRIGRGALEQAARRYHDRFDVGQDSRG